MLRRVSCAIFIIAIFWPGSGFSVSKTIVINSFKIAGTKSTDEYIELLNVSASTVNISGWQLAKKTASGSKYNLVTSFPSLEILPGESLIVGHQDSSENIDLKYTTGYSVAEDNAILLFSDAGKTIVDKVGFGKAIDFEGTVLSAAGEEAWSRASGVDTDDNLKDFQKESADGSTKDYGGICITELMPDPGSGGEEWIELYNSETTKDIGGLVISDKLGSTKKFTVPAGTIIEEGKYVVFYAKDTGIALNNDGDGTLLLDAAGNTIDDTGDSFGASRQGYSWAYDGEKWQWSKTPTPGAQNIITVVMENQAASSKTTKKKSTAKVAKTTKGKAPKAEVLGSTATGDGDVLNPGEQNISESDRMLGYALIGVALFGGLAYTIYVNREKLRETFKREREKHRESRGEIREKMQGWRNLPAFRRTRGWKDTVRQRLGKISRREG